MPCSRISGEYPLLSSASQSLTDYTIKTWTCRYTEDLEQTLIVPDFAGWSSCNVVQMGRLLYWVMDSRTGTDTQSSLKFTLSVCGASSLLSSGQSVTGAWSRLPTNICPYIQHQAMSSDMVFSRSVDLPDLGKDPLGRKLFWVQVTATVAIDDSGTVSAQDTLTRYGFFAGYTNGFSTAVYPSTSALDGVYPTMDQIINSPEMLGFQANTIIDISVSERCPWRYTKSAAGTIASAMQLTSGAPQISVPQDVIPLKIYRLDRAYMGSASPPVPLTESLTVTLSALEQSSGSVTLRATDGSAIAAIPPSLGRTIPVQVQCIGDYSAIYTRILIAGTWYTIPEGHIPWVGSAWEEYRAYSMAYDRQAMEQSIDYANQRVALGLAEAGASAVSNVAMGTIGGTPLSIASGTLSGAVGYAISAWARVEEQRISESESRATQALAERRVRGQAGTPYNAGYGMIYCDTAERIGLQIGIDMPKGLTAGIDVTYTDCFGYPCEGIWEITVQEGYYRGRLLDSALTRGRLFDKASEELQNGLRFVEVL